MKTINQQKDTLFLQYSLESFIEKYNSTEKESQKYLTKYMLLEFLTDNKIQVQEALDYMMLQSEKFCDFISLLENTEQEDYEDEDYFDIENDNKDVAYLGPTLVIHKSSPLYDSLSQLLKGYKNEQ